jgi:hypothetical protein
MTQKTLRENFVPLVITPNTAWENGFIQGHLDSGRIYNGGENGYDTLAQRDSYRRGYEAGWESIPSTPDYVPNYQI